MKYMENNIYILLVDESGNSGTDWTNDSSPFCVQGGWLVEKKIMIELEQSFSYLKQLTQSNELKSKNILKKESNYREILNAFSNLLKKSVLPFAIISEKRYSMSAKIIESFLDPQYNSILSGEILSKRQLKINIANFLYETSIDFKSFNELYSNKISGKEDKIEIVINMKNKLMYEIDKNSTLYKILSSLDEKAYECIISEFCDFDNSSKLILTTSLINLVHRAYDYVKCKNAKMFIKYDALRGFERVFDFLNTNMFGKEDIKYKFDDIVFMPKMKDIIKIEMCDSKTNFFIQLSDLWCGVLNKLFNKIRDNHSFDNYEYDLLKIIFVLVEEGKTIDLDCSNKIRHSFYSKLFMRTTKYEKVKIDSLDEMLSKYVI